MLIRIDGSLKTGVTSKDIILHVCGVIKFSRKAMEKLSMEARMSISNMVIEAGARAKIITPNKITFDYLKGQPMSPEGEDWNKAVAYWTSLRTDEGAAYGATCQCH